MTHSSATAEASAAQGTGLIRIDPARFLALNLTEEMRAAQEAALATGESFGPGDLVHVPTPAGGATNWTIPNPAGDETTPEIAGALVCYQPCGLLWPAADPTPGAIPVLRTFAPTDPNGVAEQVGPIPDEMLDGLMKHKISDGPPATFRWANLPQNQWGSGKGGTGKLCKEQRMLFILREGDVYPLLVRAQPGSLKNVSRFFKQLTPTAKVPYFRCVISLRLERTLNKAGQPFSRIVPKLVGVLPSDVGEVLRSQYTATLQKIVRDVEFEAEGDGGDE
jgi:hypothetical protein